VSARIVAGLTLAAIAGGGALALAGEDVSGCSSVVRAAG